MIFTHKEKTKQKRKQNQKHIREKKNTKTNMLSIEKKKTDKLDLVAPISQFVKNRYGAQQWQDHEAAFKDLQNLRDQVTSTSDKSEGLRDMMYR